MSEKIEGNNLEDNLDTKKDSLKTGEKISEVSATKVEHLNFDGGRFKSTPQQADKVTDVKTAEKFVSDTNRMMEEVKEDETKLEKSVMRQEILTERITSIGNSASANTSKLARRQETNNRREEEKIEQLNLELSTKLADLEEKRAQLGGHVPGDMDAKIAFIQSRGGQELIEQLLVDSLAENNEELISLAQSMVGERDVINEDPKSEFGELIERLATKHEFLVTEGPNDDMMAIPFYAHISKEASYMATLNTEGTVLGMNFSTRLIDDPYASTGYALGITNKALSLKDSKNYKLSQRVGPDVDAGITEFNFFEIAGDGVTQISRATKLRFEGNTLNFSYQGNDGGETWTINASSTNQDNLAWQMGAAAMSDTFLIPSEGDMVIPEADQFEKAKGMGE